MLALLGIHQHLTAEQKQDIATAAVHSTPGAVASAAANYKGVYLSDVLTLCSIGFIVIQVAYVIWKWRRDYLRDQARQRLSKHARVACDLEDEA